MARLKENHLVEKRNILNEIRANNMTMQELRFFAIYLSKINARDKNTRVVRFPIDDFKAIMELGRIDIRYMKGVTNNLLSKVVNVPIEDENGKYKGYTGFQLFKRCRVSHDDNGEWYVEIDAHDDALPLMFDFKKKYFSYHVFNALRLRSTNQLRMYELLKQYENFGSKVYVVDELKQDLWIGKDEYPRFGDFKTYVLNVCQQALLENTDIKFTFEPYGKRGKGGKVLKLKFYIEKNDDYVDQLTLDMFIDEQKAAYGGYGDEQDEYLGEDGNDTVEEAMRAMFRKRIEFLMEACANEFTFQEVVVLFQDMNKKLPNALIMDDVQCYDYLNDKYQEMKMHNERRGVRHRHSYMRSIIGAEY